MVRDKGRRQGSATAQELDFYREKNKRKKRKTVEGKRVMGVEIERER